MHGLFNPLPTRNYPVRFEGYDLSPIGIFIPDKAPLYFEMRQRYTFHKIRLSIYQGFSIKRTQKPSKDLFENDQITKRMYLSGMNEDYPKLLKYAVEAASNAALAISQVKAKGYQTNYKADASPVTEADLAAHNAIKEVLQKLPFPLLSEEGALPEYDERKSWNTYWSIDPLDGTKEFVRGSVEYTVNIALIVNQKPVAGVIILPETQNCTWGGPNIGLFCSKTLPNIDELFDDKYRLQQNEFPEVFTAVVSRAHLNSKTKYYLSKLEEKHEVIKTRRAGSSTKFIALAKQKAHIYPRFSPCMEWDTAAGHALLLATDQDIISLETNKSLKYNRESLYNPPFIAGKTDFYL